MTIPPRLGTVPAPALVWVLLAVALATGACSGDRKDAAAPTATSASASASSSPTPAELSTKVTVGRVTGHLRSRERKHLKTAVTHVVDGWFDAAFVGGRYPRGDFHRAFPRFTSGARADARHDRRLMSNADIGRRIDSVEATRRRLRIDVLAVRGRPVGVTARVGLDLATTGRLHKHLEVKGRLFLTRTGAGWRVFGYDITKGGTR